MPAECLADDCPTPVWMRVVLGAAGLAHLAMAVRADAGPWSGAGAVNAVLGAGLLVAVIRPLRFWPVVLAGFAKVFWAGGAALLALPGHGGGSWPALRTALVEDLVWCLPLGAILWAAFRRRWGIPFSRREPLALDEALAGYRLSSGESIAEASAAQPLAMVFLRHFGCTFTRQILRGLESMQAEAAARGTRLVLVHMLRSGQEHPYFDGNEDVARVADPRCELYRAFGLGKAGFADLFGPRVWWLGALSVFKGCGVGHLAGDGLQMPGTFIIRDGRIIAAQPARSPADLPDLAGLFAGLPSPPARDTLSA